MQVERYIFFPKCAERFGLVSPGLLLEGRDEDGEQGMLHSALQVLAEASAHLTCLKCGAGAMEAPVLVAEGLRPLEAVGMAG